MGKGKKRPRAKNTNNKKALQAQEGQDDYSENVAGGLVSMFQKFISQMQGEDNGPPAFIKPMKVDDEVKHRISNLPPSENIFYASTIDTMEQIDDFGGVEETISGNVYLVTKEHGSNGKSVQEDGDGIGFHLAMALEVFRPNTMRSAANSKQNQDVLLGTIATACLEPMKNMSHIAHMASFSSCRPRKVGNNISF